MQFIRSLIDDEMNKINKILIILRRKGMKKALLSLAILVIGLSFVYDVFSEEVKEEYRRTQEKVVPQEIIGKIPSYFTYEGSEVLITYKPSG